MTENSISLVSVIIPCRNEEKYIDRVLRDLLAQDYPHGKLEAWVMDGMSEDNTVQIIKKYASDHSWINFRTNEKKIVPPALNEGIRLSKGDIIVRLDAHASYPPDYISKLVSWLGKLKADNVGGVWITKPSSDSSVAKAIGIALSHPFGVGNAMFRIGSKIPIEADTVPFGCFRRDVFERFGFYDERLERNQDIALNKRIKYAGGRIYLVPDVQCTYFSRDTYYKLAKNNYQNGRWAILTPWFTGTFNSLSIRHFIPLGFVVYFLMCIPLVCINWIFIIPLVIYFSMNLLLSLKKAIFSKSLSLFLPLFIAFIVLHFSYGLGSIAGLFHVLISKKDKT